jgi:DUF917 family protein
MLGFADRDRPERTDDRRVGQRRQYELTFWNEYMSLKKEGERIGTFPDLLATFDVKQVQPLPTEAIRSCSLPRISVQLPPK